MTERFDFADAIRSFSRDLYPNSGDRNRAVERLDALVDGTDEFGRIIAPPIDRSPSPFWRIPFRD